MSATAPPNKLEWLERRSLKKRIANTTVEALGILMSHHCKDPRVLNVAQLVQALDWMARPIKHHAFLLHMSVNEVVFFQSAQELFEVQT